MKQYKITLKDKKQFLCFEDELEKWKKLYDNCFDNCIIKIEELK